MATLKNYLDLAGLTEYDGLIKAWANAPTQLAYKTVAKSADGNNLLFFKKANAVVGTDAADVTIPLGSADAAAKIAALAAIVPATWDSTNEEYTITGLTTTETSSIVGAINELKADQPVALEVLATPTTGMLKTYKLWQGTNTAGSGEPDTRTAIGVIDIPKDFLVKSGKVVTITEDPDHPGQYIDSDGDIVTGYLPGTYIKLVINAAESPTTDTAIYINVANLVDIYHGKANATEIQVTVGNQTTGDDYEISADVVDIMGTKITYKAAYTDETDPENPVEVPRESVTDALNNITAIPSASIQNLFS